MGATLLFMGSGTNGVSDHLAIQVRLAKTDEETVAMVEMRYDDGRYYMVVVCDVCGAVIERGIQGNYEFAHSASLDGGPVAITTPIYFAHKHCSEALEAAKCPHGDLWATTPLEFYPLRLAASLRVDLDETIGILQHLSKLP